MTERTRRYSIRRTPREHRPSSSEQCTPIQGSHSRSAVNWDEREYWRPFRQISNRQRHRERLQAQNLI